MTGVLIPLEKLPGSEWNLYEPANIEPVHHVQQGYRAHTLQARTWTTWVKIGEVIIVDEFHGPA